MNGKKYCWCPNHNNGIGKEKWVIRHPMSCENAAPLDERMSNANVTAFDTLEEVSESSCQGQGQATVPWLWLELFHRLIALAYPLHTALSTTYAFLIIMTILISLMFDFLIQEPAPYIPKQKQIYKGTWVLLFLHKISLLTMLEEMAHSL